MHVAELWRYPVKSLAGERLEQAEIRPDGMVGDRLVQVYDARGHVVTAPEAPGSARASRHARAGRRAAHRRLAVGIAGGGGRDRAGGRMEGPARALHRGGAVRHPPALGRDGRRDRGARGRRPAAPAQHRGRRGGRARGARVAGAAPPDRRGGDRRRPAARPLRDDHLRPRYPGAGPRRAAPDRPGVRWHHGARLRRPRRRPPSAWAIRSRCSSAGRPRGGRGPPAARSQVLGERHSFGPPYPVVVHDTQLMFSISRDAAPSPSRWNPCHWRWISLGGRPRAPDARDRRRGTTRSWRRARSSRASARRSRGPPPGSRRSTRSSTGGSRRAAHGAGRPAHLRAHAGALERPRGRHRARRLGGARRRDGRSRPGRGRDARRPARPPPLGPLRRPASHGVARRGHPRPGGRVRAGRGRPRGSAAVGARPHPAGRLRAPPAGGRAGGDAGSSSSAPGAWPEASPRLRWRSSRERSAGRPADRDCSRGSRPRPG